MGRIRFFILLFSFILLCVLAIFIFRSRYFVSDLNINHPFNNALFPPEFPGPRFEWWSEFRDPSVYEVSLYTANKKYAIHLSLKQKEWTPDESAWDSLKLLSDYGKIYFSVKRTGQIIPSKVYFRISRDSVNAPVLYRQMPIPFLVAEKKLDSMSYMLVNFGSAQPPHVVMKSFPVCGNCHSFTADGRTIGLDLDAGLRDKGGYFVADIRDTIVFDMDDYRSWSRLEKRRTFGLFSKLSPDGRYIVTTVKDRVVAKNFRFTTLQNLIYSQLFFPVNGHLAVFDRQTGILKELPGADLDDYVQSNAVWTPDGKNIIFSRAEALPRDSDQYEIDIKNEDLLQQFVDRKKGLKFNLCIIPFNNGKGGKAEPVEGASDNGKSNYFPAVSPDGKWIIFCQAENFMLLMPDSRLYIVPLRGGKARKLACNFNSMNSWHSWSPNSKWIVFASKALNPYTDMYLSHIDENGHAAIPVLVDRVRAQSLVINYPEFINRDPDKPFVMKYDFVELAHIDKAVRSGDITKARQLFVRFENQHLYLFKEDCEQLSDLLVKMGMNAEAARYKEMASRTSNSDLFKN